MLPTFLTVSMSDILKGLSSFANVSEYSVKECHRQMKGGNMYLCNLM